LIEKDRKPGPAATVVHARELERVSVDLNHCLNTKFYILPLERKDASGLDAVQSAITLRQGQAAILRLQELRLLNTYGTSM